MHIVPKAIFLKYSGQKNIARKRSMARPPRRSYRGYQMISTPLPAIIKTTSELRPLTHRERWSPHVWHPSSLI
jgi:hypothetical protein